MYKYPVYQPSLNGNEKKYVDECLSSTWISSKGFFINEFENKFANYINVKHAASVCNGTVAIHLALAALGIGVGDEVIVPTFTYIASVNPIVQVGATPIFVDSLENTWQIDPNEIEKKITSKTRAIMVVHLYGHPCDMDTIMAIAKQYNLLIIEDCAEAIGTKYKDKYVGSFGDISTFSFFGNKTITCGEGGMVVTNNTDLYNLLFRLKGQGLAKNREYWHDILGFNYRMTNIAAAIGLAQLEQVETFLNNKQQIALWYQKYLKDTPIVFHNADNDVYHSYWMCSILTENNQQRELLRDHLKKNAIETRPTFYPVHSMPIYEKYNQEYYPIATDLSQRGINLPSYPDLTEHDVINITEVIKKYYE